MAGGWTRDRAVQDQIDDSVTDAVLAARARLPKGDSEPFCAECGEAIPAKRRQAMPGVKTCVACQAGRDRQVPIRQSTGAAARTANCAEAREAW